MATATTAFRHLMARFALLVVMGAVFVMAQPLPARAFVLPADVESFDLTPHLTFASGTSASVDDMLARYRDGSFSQNLSVSQFEANHAPERWAVIELTAEVTRQGRVLLDIPLASEVDVYVVGSNQPLNVLSFSLFRNFDASNHAGGRLATDTLKITPGQPLLVLAHVKFGPFQSLELRFEAASATLAQSLTDVAIWAAFYAFGIASLFIFLALFAALKDWIGLLYAVLFFVSLLFMAFIDGLLFRFLYPGLPQFQQLVGFFLIFSLSGAGFALAAYGFASSRQSRAMRICQSLGIVSLIGFLASLVSPGPYVAGLGNLLLAGMFAAVILGTRAWEASQIASQRIGALLGVIAGGTIAVLILLPLLGSDTQVFDIPQTAKMIYLILLLATLFNFTAQVMVIRREHDEAIAAELAALGREAQLNRDLFETEQNYSRARDLARSSRRQLATASHDLRQPLMSLRMSVDSLAGDIDPKAKSRLTEAFDYISALSESYLDDATNTEADSDAGTKDDPEDEPYALSLILETVHQMFREEAAAKGLSLRVVPSEAVTRIPALDLMRISSNLVSNAIKYTTTGGVLFGVRSYKGQPALAVYDSGPGMTQEDIAKFRAEGVKGEQSEGHGLGLAVCYELAVQNRLDLTVRSELGQGTVFMLSLTQTSIGESTP